MNEQSIKKHLENYQANQQKIKRQELEVANIDLLKEFLEKKPKTIEEQKLHHIARALLFNELKKEKEYKVFSKTQAKWIMWSTILIAFFTAYPTLERWGESAWDLIKPTKEIVEEKIK